MNMRERVWILGVPLAPLTAEEALATVAEWLRAERGRTRLIFTPNAEIIARAQVDPELRAALAGADLTVPDGIGVVWASRFLGTPVPERVPGIELLEAVLGLAARQGYRVFFLGGRPGVAEEAAARLSARWPGLQVTGTHHGYFGPDEEEKVLENIRAAAPDILVVALGAPKQELWLTRHKEELTVRVALGVGGSLDVLAGRVKRAPQLFRRLGLEWLYRILRQPERWRRAVFLPRFVLAVLAEALARKRGRE
ncbi:MAG: N-acetylglucosaminyldiphosphoundecaprenol N-acetyl-beta-D-mannosaminyltransferase [Bacillota bacterium]|nr:N-acetylglucosaminyldiphosphoundecaprenol N-acetyl-beta-D-mannosaminyltransferase [Bacillota bacterium]MDK2856680.1 N-acetylglucosaminyldiphosphoundecaprenol N-acetyl-beta-D-mannosaminyltransferase [Bacillota bacterium]MDK2925330.1 N-acetylglucosaminyldiphosphoundecaprenol N-acetyl-beta-D-mannosaminyltransferase [Bacillota bacterium]